MSEAVLVAIITGGLTLIGTVFTVFATSSRTNAQLRINQAQNAVDLFFSADVEDHVNIAGRGDMRDDIVLVRLIDGGAERACVRSDNASCAVKHSPEILHHFIPRAGSKYQYICHFWNLSSNSFFRILWTYKSCCFTFL